MTDVEPSDGMSVRVDRLSVYSVMTVEGSIDFGTHERLGERLTEALELTRTAVIVDMAAVGFCDSAGLRVFARAIRETRMRGMSLVVTGLHGRVANVFEMTGLAQEMFVRTDVESAVSWLETGQSRVGERPTFGPGSG
ncbi:STAS domain-containing protein [Spirillospora sp. NPDC048911]|uniref:STAS domain-containing protein n=1 Tax=Spirillospora sp. NPDC048911 TaxID=3364527 RepID=UPI0037115C7A